MMMKRNHLYPCRTQKLSSSMQTIVSWRRLVKICNCRVQEPEYESAQVFLLHKKDDYYILLRGYSRVLVFGKGFRRG